MSRTRRCRLSAPKHASSLNADVRFPEIMKYAIHIGLTLGLIVIVTGCATGPVRYKTFGYRKFATVEMTKRATPVLKPFAAPAGLVADTSLIILDTVATPIVSVPIAFELMGPCPQPTTRRNVVVKTLTAPLWFTISYPYISLGMPFRNTNFYADWFGQEGKTFSDQKENQIEQSVPGYPPQGVGSPEP